MLDKILKNKGIEEEWKVDAIKAAYEAGTVIIDKYGCVTPAWMELIAKFQGEA